MSQPSCWQIALASHHIRRHRVIAYATESVWGLGCDPASETALEKVIALKGRAQDKGLILLSGFAGHFSRIIAPLSQEDQRRFVAIQERPTTWLVPDPDNQYSHWIKGKFDFVAVRVTGHPVVKALTERLGHPVVSTSANISGRPTAANSLQIRKYFGDELDYTLPGWIEPGARPSRIVNLITGEVIRP